MRTLQRRECKELAMKLAESGFYVEEYVKCTNCGELIYKDSIQHEREGASSSSVLTGAWNGRLGGTQADRPHPCASKRLPHRRAPTATS
jgi:hypothetical protein